MRRISLLRYVTSVAAASVGLAATALPALGQVVSGRSDSVAVGKLLLITGGQLDSIRAIAQEILSTQVGSPEWFKLQRRMEALVPTGQRLTVGKVAAAARMTGYVGISVGGAPYTEESSPSGSLVQYYSHPTIVSVDPDSPAQRVGIAPGDVLIAYNGQDVVEHPYNRSRLFEPGRKVQVKVRRDGETKDYTLVVGPASTRVFMRQQDLEGAAAARAALEASDRGDDAPRHVPLVAPRGMVMPGLAPGMMVFSAPAGIFGANLSVVSAELSRALKLERGVLVNDVPDGSVAARAGLQAGDVIVTVAGEPVTTLYQLQAVVMAHANDRTVALRVFRDRKPRTVSVSW